MMKTTRILRYGLILVISLLDVGLVRPGRAAPFAANTRQSLPPVLILEDQFDPAEWTVTAVAFGGSTYTVTQQLTGGYGSPPFRFMAHHLPPVTNGGLNSIEVTHLYTGDTYDPGVQGAITAIDYSEAGHILSFPWPEAFSNTWPVVVQDGQVYRTRGSDRIQFIADNSTHDWETKSLLQLTAADFSLVGGSEDDHPDFSVSGSPLQFGFIRYNSRSTSLPLPPENQQNLVIEQGVDNWQLTVHREPEISVNQPPQAADDVFILNGYNRRLPLFEFFDVVRNDSDPDSDFLDIISVTQPGYGTAGKLSAHTVVYQLDEAQVYDTFDYTISDDEFTDTAQVEVYVDCACTVLCLNNLELPDPTPPPFVSAAATATTTDTIDLPLIYRVRDRLLKTTPDGRRYVDMYYNSNPEILVNIMTNPALRTEAVDTVELWQPNLASLVNGDGNALITQAQVDAVESFLMNLSAVSSPELQQLIDDELERLGPLDDYVGLSMSAAKRQAIGDATLYLPLVAAP